VKSQFSNHEGHKGHEGFFQYFYSGFFVSLVSFVVKDLDLLGDLGVLAANFLIREV